MYCRLLVQYIQGDAPFSRLFMNRQLPPDLQNELQALLGDRYCTDITARQAHSNGFSYHVPMLPDCVVFPESTEEVAAIVSHCHTYKIPVIPFGAGTSVEGHVLAVKGGICIDVSKMTQVLAVADMYASVQAGVTRSQIAERLAGSGYFFPIGPGVNATLGGWYGQYAGIRHQRRSVWHHER